MKTENTRSHMPSSDGESGRLASDLTPMQEAFVRGIASGLSQSEAYRQAYPRSQKWAAESVRVNAAKLSADTNVSLRIKELQAEAAKIAGLVGAEILWELRCIALSDIGEIMHPDGRVKLPSELPRATRAAVASFKIDEYGRIEYKFWDKNVALEKAMKHLGLYEIENKQRTNPLQELIKGLSGNVVKPVAIGAEPDDEAA